MSDEEMEMLKALAANASVTASDVVRRLVRKEHARMVAKEEPKNKAQKR